MTTTRKQAKPTAQAASQALMLKTPQIAVQRDYEALQAERAYNADAYPRTLRVLAARAWMRGDTAEAERLEMRAVQSAKFWREVAR